MLCLNVVLVRFSTLLDDFGREEDKTQSTICIHVDDMMQTAMSESHLDDFSRNLRSSLGMSQSIVGGRKIILE